MLSHFRPTPYKVLGENETTYSLVYTKLSLRIFVYPFQLPKTENHSKRITVERTLRTKPCSR